MPAAQIHPHFAQIRPIGVAALCLMISATMPGCASDQGSATPNGGNPAIGSVSRSSSAGSASDEFLNRYVETGGFRRGTPSNITPTPNPAKSLLK